MKIILSRKGFDAGYGGIPSIILPDGEMISFPIPSLEGDIKYNELRINENLNYNQLISQLNNNKIKIEGFGEYDLGKVGCHLDPDLRSNIIDRESDWRGLFGQAGSAQTHLVNKGVSKGDIFLFFGWFCETIERDGKFVYKTSKYKGFHAIYGYLQVEEILNIYKGNLPGWMKYHPHVRRGDTAKENDVVYVATNKLSFDNTRLGYGTFKYKEELKLTKEGMSRSKWNLPDIFKNVDISYHTKNSWGDEYFQSATKGQEFVIDSNEKIIEWVKTLIINNKQLG